MHKTPDNKASEQQQKNIQKGYFKNWRAEGGGAVKYQISAKYCIQYIILKIILKSSGRGKSKYYIIKMTC